MCEWVAFIYICASCPKTHLAIMLWSNAVRNTQGGIAWKVPRRANIWGKRKIHCEAHNLQRPVSLLGPISCTAIWMGGFPCMDTKTSLSLTVSDCSVRLQCQTAFDGEAWGPIRYFYGMKGCYSQTDNWIKTRRGTLLVHGNSQCHTDQATIGWCSTQEDNLGSWVWLVERCQEHITSNRTWVDPEVAAEGLRQCLD